MLPINRLVAEAVVLAGGEHQCAALGHKWIEDGGRRCPKEYRDNCSQTVYFCESCGIYDYGEKYGPGYNDCEMDCPGPTLTWEEMFNEEEM